MMHTEPADLRALALAMPELLGLMLLDPPATAAHAAVVGQLPPSISLVPPSCRFGTPDDSVLRARNTG